MKKFIFTMSVKDDEGNEHGTRVLTLQFNIPFIMLNYMTEKFKEKEQETDEKNWGTTSDAE